MGTGGDFVKTPFEPSKLLDRGGKPTVRELLSSLVFNPIDGTIRLNGDRIVVQRASVGVELRRELTRLLGPQEARVFLLRLGFLTGQADARFVRTSWPNVDVGDAFTAGTRLHTFSGVVRVETVYNDFDFRKKRFAGEFLWHDSVEAADFRRLRPTTEAVCWTQLGYASGYASEFFDTLVVYKEVECAAQGHNHCRVVGKPADVWGAGDPEVILFRERIATADPARLSEPLRKVAARTAEHALSELDRLILAPVRSELDRLAPMAFPVLLAGAPGTGRGSAARYLHRAAGPTGTELRHVFGRRVDLDFCAEIARHGSRRRGAAGETILIDAAEEIPADVQPHLARAIEEGMLVGGPRIMALVSHDATAGAASPPPLSAELWYALSGFTVRMPGLDERDGERAAIAQALLPILAHRMGMETQQLDDSAAKAIERAAWPGNLRQMRTVLSAVLAEHRGERPVSRVEIEAQLKRLRVAAPATGGDGEHRLQSVLDQLLEEGGLSLPELERSAYQAAVERAGGNLSAAARLLGLTRAQLAYRLSTNNAPA
jgi:transcriptional regulator with AAA-type ATPase domain